MACRTTIFICLWRALEIQLLGQFPKYTKVLLFMVIWAHNHPELSHPTSCSFIAFDQHFPVPSFHSPCKSQSTRYIKTENFNNVSIAHILRMLHKFDFFYLVTEKLQSCSVFGSRNMMFQHPSLHKSPLSSPMPPPNACIFPAIC